MSHQVAEAIDLTWAISEYAACKSQWRRWSDLEVGYRLAETPQEARRVAREIRLICDSCPLADFQLCRQWAITDHYSGWAAGELFENGRPLKTTEMTRRIGSHERAEKSAEN